MMLQHSGSLREWQETLLRIGLSCVLVRTLAFGDGAVNFPSLKQNI